VTRSRLAEAAGDLTDDRDLKRDGRTDRASASAKARVDELADRAHEGLDDAKDRIEGLVEEGRKGAQSGR